MSDKLELECDEIADLKMMRDNLERITGTTPDCFPSPDRRPNLINKILDHVEQPEVDGMHQVR